MFFPLVPKQVWQKDEIVHLCSWESMYSCVVYAWTYQNSYFNVADNHFSIFLHEWHICPEFTYFHSALIDCDTRLKSRLSRGRFSFLRPYNVVPFFCLFVSYLVWLSVYFVKFCFSVTQSPVIDSIDVATHFSLITSYWCAVATFLSCFHTIAIAMRMKEFWSFFVLLFDGVFLLSPYCMWVKSAELVVLLLSSKWQKNIALRLYTGERRQ